jgi:hypothetical protein
MNVWQFLGDMHVHMKGTATSAIPRNTMLTFHDVLNPPLKYLDYEGHWRTASRASQPQDLSDPWTNLQIRYDDLGTKPDNFRDLIIEVNPATYKGLQGWYAIFWCEGSVEKWICYKDRLIHHYSTAEPLQHYGIFHTADLSLKGPCPFPGA